MKLSPLAGKPAEQDMRLNIPRLVTAYCKSTRFSYHRPTVAFGTFYDRIEAKITPEQKKKLKNCRLRK